MPLASLAVEPAAFLCFGHESQQSRDRLLYVYPGEESYLVMGTEDKRAAKTPTTESGTPVSAKVQTPKVDWVQAMLSSVMQSGLTDERAADLVAPDVSGTGDSK